MKIIALALAAASSASAANAQLPAPSNGAPAGDAAGVLPAGVNAPAWAKPQSSPAPRPATPQARRIAEDPASIYAAAEAPDTRLRRGAIVKDKQNAPIGTMVRAGSRLAIVVVGSHEIQVPANALRGDGDNLVLAMSPADIENVIAASTKFQAQTAKLAQANTQNGPVRK